MNKYFKGSYISRGGDGPAFFPPQMVIQVKALACELPSETGMPLSRLSTREIAREAVRRGIVASISGKTIWRWLDEDAIRPCHYRSWIFPRDPDFCAKASRVLDLYQGIWNDPVLGEDDFVLSADEKTSVQVKGLPLQPDSSCPALLTTLPLRNSDRPKNRNAPLQHGLINCKQNLYPKRILS